MHLDPNASQRRTTSRVELRGAGDLIPASARRTTRAEASASLPRGRLSRSKESSCGQLIREGKFPLIGDGRGVWSFIYVADAAQATVAAVELGSRGIYNVVDDDPAPVARWLPALAKLLGAEEPMQVPPSTARELVGEAGVVMMTEIRGASNAKAKRELGWVPAPPSWRQGFTAT